LHIQMTNLGKTYGTNQAIHRVNLTVQKGLFGLLGPNGAGKTTLMQILATLTPPTEGQVTIGNYRLGRDDQAIRAMLGYLPQEFNLYKRLTAYEYLDYIAVMKGITNSRQRKAEVGTALERMSLTGKAGKKLGSYSGGMKQRIGIAQALLGSPALIIVDEPTAGLDLEERIRVRSLLGDLSKERIVVLSTHIAADIENRSSQLAIMKRGRVIWQGTQEGLLDGVKDRVWSGNVGEAEFEQIKQQTKVISARKERQAMNIRVLSGSLPFDGAEPAEAGLEDAYISVLETEGPGL